MRVLVTGGAGFIGSHLCDALIARGDTVWCLDNLHLGREENIAHLKPDSRFRFCRADILDRPALDVVLADCRPDFVFHLAANSDVAAGSRDRELDLRLTFQTTAEVLEAMRRDGSRQILFAGSSAVFGLSGALLNEDSGPLRPASFYGAAKMAAEAWLSVYREQFGFRVRILRFPNVVGERATHGVVHDFIAKLHRDPSRLEVLGDGSQTKPYLYVADVVEAMLLVLQGAKQPFEVYHLAGAGLTSVREIAEMVVEEMGLENISIEYGDGNTGWPGDVPYFHYDTGKIKALGFRPKYSSTEAVRLAIQRILGKEAPCKS